MSAPLRVYLVDDELLALRRLARLLEATGRVEIVGSAEDPEEALAYLSAHDVDALFLDVEMPGLNGFELLARLAEPPPVVFTTAYDEYALRAFDVYSVDYLLKPVEPARLDRALGKLERSRGGRATELDDTIARLAEALGASRDRYLDRVASRVGDRVQFVEVGHVTHFFARDKLTYASTGGREYAIDLTIADLERRLDPRRFIRVHRSAIVNVESVGEVSTRLAGRLLIRLRDARRTEIAVARDRARALRERLGF